MSNTQTTRVLRHTKTGAVRPLFTAIPKGTRRRDWVVVEVQQVTRPGDANEATGQAVAEETAYGDECLDCYHHDRSHSRGVCQVSYCTCGVESTAPDGFQGTR